LMPNLSLFFFSHGLPPPLSNATAHQALHITNPLFPLFSPLLFFSSSPLPLADMADRTQVSMRVTIRCRRKDLLSSPFFSFFLSKVSLSLSPSLDNVDFNVDPERYWGGWRTHLPLPSSGLYKRTSAAIYRRKYRIGTPSPSSSMPTIAVG